MLCFWQEDLSAAGAAAAAAVRHFPQFSTVLHCFASVLSLSLEYMIALLKAGVLICRIKILQNSPFSAGLSYIFVTTAGKMGRNRALIILQTLRPWQQVRSESSKSFSPQPHVILTSSSPTPHLILTPSSPHLVAAPAMAGQPSGQEAGQQSGELHSPILTSSSPHPHPILTWSSPPPLPPVTELPTK